ncbi:MAG TPA: NAD(P)-dependent alcohol dehydrogenase [Gordonia sp. (in: high G+C Gram-positive bacteria)]|mgnify:CR=1 FL=1|uniref:NAD(P)-dependent alcohol dehydrogenase n=3 Tax=Gordonia TaxID=2053 RepID=UPI000FB11D7D|nr:MULTISPECIES: NAD(P)-dependent alcohol dehydrogenase [unclassified Gordonia (in: high G+C Gram-positive bacteria)]RUP36636.1 MAG: NAD(P)-dependent alcohol dehydrogenase [Gordonia sp. (in: high G+C Gram-positive bacteria)]HNP56007.1 NAD(P)-dependent alcohol dehydrogenase [Gordonia sp. (in: high G+C Gram-positive bacteria)]HRC51920.1 NAD(P)-dependent alcohol dehydrogenase [Gordonia sp. (in: high G+C Gram-positive bacteria)]
MRALKLVDANRLELRDVPVPEPGPGRVRVRIAGAGICHSDVTIMAVGAAGSPFHGITLGHEGAGYVDALGAGVTGLTEGQPAIIDLMWACGHCRQCVGGRSNACQTNGTRWMFPTTPGLGPDGTMAEYIVADARHVVPLDGGPLPPLDPTRVAPLADAGVTPMHAINTVRNRLDAGAVAVVIGLGGLGHMAVQILRAVGAARIIAVDANPAKVAQATRLGADIALLSDGDTAARILEETAGFGADVVFDFVGVAPSVALATAVVAPEGHLRLAGLGGGEFTYSLNGVNAVPWGVTVQTSYGGTRADLDEVLALARRGLIHVETTDYPLEDYARAFDDLEAGRLPGRAILLP